MFYTCFNHSSEEVGSWSNLNWRAFALQQRTWYRRHPLMCYNSFIHWNLLPLPRLDHIFLSEKATVRHGADHAFATAHESCTNSAPWLGLVQWGWWLWRNWRNSLEVTLRDLLCSDWKYMCIYDIWLIGVWLSYYRIYYRSYSTYWIWTFVSYRATKTQTRSSLNS